MKYNQYSTTRFFLPDNTEETISHGWYFSNNNTDPVPQLIEVDASWNTYLGFYLFLTEPIAVSDSEALNHLVEALQGDETIQTPERTGVIWLANAIKPLNIHARIDAITVEKKPCVAKTSHLGFGTYQLPIFQGADIQLDEEALELQIGYPMIHGAQKTSVGNGIRIPITGDSSGIAIGETLINDFSSNAQTGWSVGFKYNMSHVGTLQSQFYPMFNTAPGQYVLFNMRWDPLHPLEHERSSLTFTGISLRIEKIGGTTDQFQIEAQENPNLLNTWWRTLYGAPIAVRPVLTGHRQAQLVFQQSANQGSRDPAYYLTPKGDFELCVVGQGGMQFKLLCGLAGTECFTFTAGSGTGELPLGDLLKCYPNNAAYSNDYPVVKKISTAGKTLALQADLTKTLLKDTFKTAWSAIQPIGENPNVVYFVAPEAASLYVPSSTQGVLDSYYAETAVFTTEDIETGKIAFPMVPYAGVNHPQIGAFPANDIEPFELQIIGTARKQKIGAFNNLQMPKVANNEPTVLTATPQGLLASIQGGCWKKVLLARNTDCDEDFAFVNLPSKLRNAFQTNELFLVASDAKNLGIDFQNSIEIEGWTFHANVPTRTPGTLQTQSNMLLLKFRKGSVLELIRDVNAWTDAVDFNYDEDQVVATQTWLIQYCQDAIQMAHENERYAHFAALIQDPNWYGILSLKVDIDMGAFPKDLKGLLGAMDLSRFDAHHVGVQVNYIQPEAGDGTRATGIQVKKSNLFALISYIDPSYQQSQRSDARHLDVVGLTDAASSMDQVTYAYKVLTLQIVFANSAITNFESKLRLTARKWFDENASLNKPRSPLGLRNDNVDEPANYAMLFSGHYENHEGHKTYTFLTQKNQSYQYFIESKVLNYVEFVKAQFNTLSSLPETPGSNVEDVICVFTFYGYLNFNELAHFDCFSYGSEKGNVALEGRGVYFSNMAVNVAFKLDTAHNTTSKMSFGFNPKHLAFDQSLSTIRKTSLGQAFPLSPHTILMGNGESTPSKQGYIHAVPPTDFISDPLENTWFGLDFELHWGGPGALADQAGFTPHLLMAWSPGTALRTEILIRLPGTASGGKALSLQNILKLKIGAFRFTITKQENDQISYNLLLTSMALSLIGLKFPAVGNTDLMLLGDPAEPGSMGWYGVYINE